PDGDGELVELLRPDADAVVGGPRHRRDGLLERVVTNLDRFGKLFGGEFGRPAGMRLDANGRERRVRGEVQAYGGGPGGVGFVRYPDGDLGPRARGVGVPVDGDMSGSGCRGGHGDDGDAARGEPDARERTRKHGHEKSLTHDDESARPSRRAAFGPQRWVSSAVRRGWWAAPRRGGHQQNDVRRRSATRRVQRVGAPRLARLDQEPSNPGQQDRFRQRRHRPGDGFGAGQHYREHTGGDDVGDEHRVVGHDGGVMVAGEYQQDVQQRLG